MRREGGEIIARFLVLPSPIASSIPGGGPWLFRSRALTAHEPAVMVSPVTLSPGGCDPSTAPLRSRQQDPPGIERAMFGPMMDVYACREHISLLRGHERKRRGGFHGSHAS